MIQPKQFLPVEVVFHPRWWHVNFGISFGEDFFFDPEVRVASEQKMEEDLYHRFGEHGLGESPAPPRPVIGAIHNAAGYMVPAILGCQLIFHEDAPPDVVCSNLSDEEVEKLEVPDLIENPLMRRLIKLMDVLHDKFGYLEGDVGWGGVQNTALDLRGQELFIDYYQNPNLAQRLLDVVSRTTLEFANYIRSRTKTSSISINRIVRVIDLKLNLHSNCSVTMIKPEAYEEFLLSQDNFLSTRLQPYGIHHCGVDMHRFANVYARVKDVSFFDVGWGSDIARCRKILPDAFFSIRLSPVELQKVTPEEVRQKLAKALLQAGPLEKSAVCCINIDAGTPDENIKTIFQVAEEFRHYGA